MQSFGNSEQLNSQVTPACWCHACRPVTMNDMRFVVCPNCGNKRCPRANDHRNDCTGSNEPGQSGSAYPAAPQPQNAPQNIPAGKSTVTPDGWISCSERMPEQGAYISAVSKHGEYVAGQVIDDWLDLHDGTSFGLDEVYLWMMLPPLPASPQQ
ncbi:TPA: DUF551 domain-containing protein [Salmonella enterica]|nr:DUF551 domain-containing protein [Salmonella enterica]HDY3114503.1 DUF551 domain-containing protein [Salmonella enterica]